MRSSVACIHGQAQDALSSCRTSGRSTVGTLTGENLNTPFTCLSYRRGAFRQTREARRCRCRDNLGDKAVPENTSWCIEEGYAVSPRRAVAYKANVRKPAYSSDQHLVRAPCWVGRDRSPTTWPNLLSKWHSTGSNDSTMGHHNIPTPPISGTPAFSQTFECVVSGQLTPDLIGSGCGCAQNTWLPHRIHALSTLQNLCIKARTREESTGDRAKLACG